MIDLTRLLSVGSDDVAQYGRSLIRIDGLTVSASGISEGPFDYVTARFVYAGKAREAANGPKLFDSWVVKINDSPHLGVFTIMKLSDKVVWLKSKSALMDASPYERSQVEFLELA